MIGSSRNGILHCSAKQDELSQYLYLQEPPESVYPVQEFRQPIQPKGGDNENGKPNFLYQSDYPHARVVEFYAPWCGHCQHFKPIYIKFAKALLEAQQQTKAAAAELTEAHDDTIEVYAVSCVPNRAICRDFEVHGFPTIRLYPAFSGNGTAIPQGKVNPTYILKELARLQDTQNNENTKDVVGGTTIGKKAAVAVGVGVGGFPHFTPRSIEEIWGDAYLSLDFVLRNGIFMSNGPLEPAASQALTEFLHVATRALPSSSSLSTLVHGLWKESSTIVQSEAKLIQVMDGLKSVLEGTPRAANQWSSACVQHGTGYTCGLWTLFHLLTVGTVEWNKEQQLQHEDTEVLLSTMEVADVIRNFVEHFFQCDECRANFLKEYDSCGYDRCNRLTMDRSTSTSLDDWKQLVLWLYETHNGVNVRLRKERIANKEPEDTTDEWQVQWPAVDQCPMCWLSHGRWDEEHVYEFLRMQYWSEDNDQQSAEFKNYLLHGHDLHPDVVSAINKAHGQVKSTTQLAVPGSFPLLVMGIVSIVAVYVYRRRRLYHLKGYHKKRESMNNC